MWEDPIVKEIRSAGEKLLKSCGGDMKILAGKLRENQLKHADKIVDKARIREARTADTGGS